MSEPITEIRALLMQFEKSGLKDMYIRSGDWAVFMAYPDGGENPMQQQAAPAPVGGAAPAPAPAAVSLAAVNAPHLGLFQPSCAAGDAVSAGQVIGVIDVLGRKTEVASASAGHVAAVHFAANDLVEYGQTLLEIAAA